MGPVLEAFATVTLDGQAFLAILKHNALSRAILLQAGACKVHVCVRKDSSAPLAKTASARRIAGDMEIVSKVSVNAFMNGLADPVS